MKLSKLAGLIALALATPMVPVAFAAVPSTPTEATEVQHVGGYLGVLLGPVPDDLRAQLGNVLPSGQGVMVRRILADSPAAKAGLKTYDILVRYNDQKVFSAEQLRQLIREEKPDTAVTLGILRNGAMQDTRVTLGQAEAMSEAGPPAEQYGYEAGPSVKFPSFMPGSAANWDSFDSMSLKKLDNGNFKAEIQFLGKDGKLVNKAFTGSRDAIRHQIMGQTDLPAAERNQLLTALSARDMIFPPSPDWVSGFYWPQWGAYGPQWFNWQPEF